MVLIRLPVTEEGTADRKHCRTTDHLYTVNLCHCHDTDVLTVSSCRYRTKASGNCGREEICKQGSVETRIFQKISSNDLSGYDLMADMLGGYQKQCRKDRHNGLKIKFRRCKVGKSQKCRFPYLCKIQKPACTCCHISRNDRDQDRNNRKEAPEQDLPEYRNSKCDQKYDHIFISICSSRSPAVLAALPASSSPISATTGPMAAVGRTMSIQLVPH